MVLVTDRNYYLDTRLKSKLDLMINRMKHGKDNLLLIDGDEGDGKTNMSFLVAYYFAHETGREFNLDHVFFDLDKLINFAVNNKEQVIVWDEGALGGLASEWWNKNQKKFIKLMMIARKKKHFWVVNIPKFFKLNEYFVIDRSIGLIHVYMRGGVKHGRFVYFNQVQKEKLWETWKKTRVRSYKKWFSFHGSFIMFLGKDRFSDLVDEIQYDAKKDDAIMSINKEPEKKDNVVLEEMKLKLLKKIRETNPEWNNNKQAEEMGISGRAHRSAVGRLNKLEKVNAESRVREK